MFTENRQRLVANRPPCTLREMKTVAREVVDQFNGRGSDLARKGDPYSAYRLVKERDLTIENLNAKVKLLQDENSNLRRQRGSGGGGYARDQGRDRGSGKGGRGAAAAVVFTPPLTKKPKLQEDPDFVRDRMAVCLQWNSVGGCKKDKSQCSQTHACNRQANDNPKLACKGDHKGSQHK